MGFEVLNDSPRNVWVPCDYGAAGDTFYVGQLVQSSGDGVAPLGQASGAYDTSGDKVIAGVIVGTNNKVKTYDSTTGLEYITSVSSQATLKARDFIMPEGNWGNDPQAMVLVAEITPETVLKGRLFNSTYGTAIDTGTVTSASTTGLGVTVSGGFGDIAGVADNSMLYCRSGANMGLYRIRTDTTLSAATCAVAFPNDIAVGDVFVGPLGRPFGLSRLQTDSESLFFDSSATVASNSWGVQVLRADLSVAGQEYLEFRFNAAHFVAK